DGQAFHAVERPARGDGERRARLGRAPALLGAETGEAAPQVGGERDLVALRAIGERLAVLAHLAAHGGRARHRHGAADDDEVARAHGTNPGGRCHPVMLRGGSIPTRRMRRYRLARSVASRRAASATLPCAADSARAMSARSYWSSASESATSVHSPARSPPAGGRTPSPGSTRATASAVMASPDPRIASRSTMLASSRTFPGQW